MIWLYRLLFLPTLLVAAPYYLRRMRKRGGYGPNFSHRFGGTPPLPPKRPGVRRIWLQAVSVGEMLAIGPLLEALRQDGTVEIYLTTTTSTGHQLARERYGPLVVALGYFPLDWWPFSWRAWRRIQPDLAILMEGERWPEHIRQAARRRVPVLSINARLLREAARIELCLRTFLNDGGFKGFTTTFEDLHGLAQLPGLPVQRLMAEGSAGCATGATAAVFAGTVSRVPSLSFAWGSRPLARANSATGMWL